MMHDRPWQDMPVGATMWKSMCGSARVIGFAGALLAGFAALAQPASELFKGADLALGERLIKENRCMECHRSKFGGDGSSIFRPQGRINTPGFLRGMVEQCNTELNLGLFPEEVSAVAAVLNRDHYRFK
jgi:hypothetical protein